MAFGVDWEDRWPDTRRRDSSEKDPFSLRGLNDRDTEMTGLVDGRHSSPTRDERTNGHVFAQPRLRQQSQAAHSSRRRSVGHDLCTSTTTTLPDYPMSPRSRSPEHGADLPRLQNSQAPQYDNHYSYSADELPRGPQPTEPPRGPRSTEPTRDPRLTKKRKPLPIDTSPHLACSGNSEHTPSRMSADRSKSRDHHRSYSDRQDAYSLPSADTYRPTYERSPKAQSMNPPLRTPKSPIQTPISAGPKTARSNRTMLSDVRSPSEKNPSVDRIVPSEHNAPPSDCVTELPEPKAQSTSRSMYMKQSPLLDGPPLPTVDIHRELNDLADSIKLSSSSIMKGDRSRRESAWRARVHQRHLRHQDTFPTLFEETEYRASRAEQLNQDIEEEADRAQRRQESASAKLAAVLQKVQPARNGSVESRDDADIANLMAELQTLKETVNTTVPMVANLKTELGATKKSLEDARQEINAIDHNFVTSKQFEARLHALLQDTVSWRHHDAALSKLDGLTLESNSRKTEIANMAKILEFVKHIPEDIKQHFSLIEKHGSKLASLRDDANKGQAEYNTLKSGLSELEKIVANDSATTQGLSSLIDKERENHRKEFEDLRGTIVELSKELRHVEDKTKDIEASQVKVTTQDDKPIQDSEFTQPNATRGIRSSIDASVTRDELETLKQGFDVGNEKLLQNIREQQNASTDAILEGVEGTANTVEQHTHALSQLKADVAAVTQTVTEISARQSKSPDSLSTDSNSKPMTSRIVQLEALTKTHGDKISDVVERHARLERAHMAMGQFVVNQQQKFDSLSSQQLTQHMIHTMVQMYPSHPAHLTAQINQLAQSQKAIENNVQSLSKRSAEINSTVEKRVVAELKPISSRIGELSSSQVDIQQSCIRTEKEVGQFKEEIRKSVANVTNEVNDLNSRLKNGPVIASPTPPSMWSRVPSISAGAAHCGADRERDSGSDSETPLRVRTTSTTRFSSTGTPINENGKRQRPSEGSSGDDIPLSASAKQKKAIKRMNKSMGGHL